MKFSVIFSYFVIAAVFTSTLANGFEASELLVVANTRMAGSVKVAKYYMAARNIPDSNLLAIPLPLSETMDRESFKKKLKDKVAKKLSKVEENFRIAAIVLMYGVPLKVDAPRPSWETLDKIKEIETQILELKQDPEKDESVVKDIIAQKRKQVERLSGMNMRAAVDSELSLVKVEKYALGGWVKNPFFPGHSNDKGLLKKGEVLLVARLDGPDLKTVYRIINDAVKVEQQGLKGIAYFDARWPYNEKQNQSGYQLYDSSLHLAAAATKKRMETVVDDKEQLFKEHSCPDAALYSGWYSYAKYVDSFTWVPGAIGYHIASAEAQTLRSSDKPLWCVKMLEKGVAATIGPVFEPYVQGFPLPEIFFTILTEGYLSLGEAFLVSLPYISWQTILIGDPLYRPFRPMH